MLTGNQLKAARALLGIDQNAMADLADVSPQTIQRIERGGASSAERPEIVSKIVDALALAGIELLKFGGRGVQVKTATRPRLPSWSELTSEIWLK